MDIIKHALGKFNIDEGNTAMEDNIKPAETPVLSEMKGIKIESITTESITFEGSISTSYYYRIYFKSEDGCTHRTYIDESLFNLLINAYEWMEIDRNEHTETDPDTGHVAKEINSIMIAVTHNNKD